MDYFLSSLAHYIFLPITSNGTIAMALATRYVYVAKENWLGTSHILVHFYISSKTLKVWLIKIST
jgi:hypothetical protein